MGVLAKNTLNKLALMGHGLGLAAPNRTIDHARNDQFPHHTVTLARRLSDSDRLRFHSRPLKVTIK